VSSDDRQSGIKSWAEEDRPREKLLLSGKKSLTNAELIAILLGSGSRNETAVELARRMLSGSNQNLHELAKLGVKELSKFKGIGEAKAISIIAALELGRRQKASDLEVKPKITCSADIYILLQSSMEDLPTEVFRVIYLNRQNAVIKTKTVSEGGIAGTVVDPRIIFKEAIDVLAVSIILAHNHPSGNLKPSQADITITKKMVEAGKLLDISVLDHLIIAETGYYSFADEGLL
jgi:DNA repair protein RadC